MLSPDIYSMWLEAGKIAELARPDNLYPYTCNDGSRLLPRPISICEIDRDMGIIRLVYRIAVRERGSWLCLRLLISGGNGPFRKRL
jgi:dihydroorotate dehydrogenase electron transfer subunit